MHIPLRTRSLFPIGLLLAGNVLFGAGLFFHAFLYNFYLEGLGHGEELMGHAAAALTSGGLAVLLPAGWLVDRVGARATMVLAGVVTALGLSAGAVVVEPLPIFFAAAVAGVGAGIWRVSVPPLLMDLTKEHDRPRVFAWNVGLLVAAGGLGTAAAGALPAWLESRWGLETLGGIRAALLLGAGITCASSVAFAVAKRSAGHSSLTRQDGPRGGPQMSLATLGTVGLAVLLVALWMLGPALAAPFLNIFFTREFAVSIQQTGLIFAVSHVGWALLVIGSGEIAGRLGPDRVLRLMLPLFAPLVWGVSIVGTLTLASVFYFAQGAVSPIANPLIDQALLGRSAKARHGLVSSLRNMAADVSAIVGASVGGVLLAKSGFDALFLTAGGIALVGAVGLIAALRRLQPASSPLRAPAQGD